MSADSRIAFQPPPGFRWVRLLAEAPGRAVWLAEHASGPVVVRCEAGESSQDLGELAVLASLDHPGLARLVDHGSLPGGGRFLARAWTPGVDLGEWVRAHPGGDPRLLGVLIARLCLPLEALHRAGFVHADLKPENVIVGPAGETTLTDFGLAGRTGRAQDAVAGTVFALAPEVLRGEALDPRTDLFALGVLIVQVFGGLRRAARDFYGRFPSADFFEAAGSTPADLPDWLGDVAARLVERDPEARPASAADVGRLLCARLGEQDLAREFGAASGGPRFPVRRGREDRFAALADACLESRGLTWVRIQQGEDAAAVARELRVLASLRGVELEPGAPVRGGTQAEVETWIRARKGATLIALAGRDPSQRRAVEALARGLAPLERLVFVCSEAPPASDLAWRELSLPPVPLAAVIEVVDAWLPIEDPASRRAFAATVHAAGGGRAQGIERAIERVQRLGAVLPSGRLRPGRVLTSVELTDASAPNTVELAPTERALLALLSLLRGRAPVGAALALCGQDPDRLRIAVASLEARGLCAWAAQGSAPLLEARVPLDPRDFPLELRRTAAASLAPSIAGRSPEPDAAAARLAAEAWSYVAGTASARRFARTLADAREQGSPEAAMACAEDARWALGEHFEGAPCAELALCSAQVGELDRALELAAELSSSASAPDRAASERIRGRVALQRHEPAAALEHFGRAAELDPNDGGEALLARVQLCAQLGRDAEVLALHADRAVLAHATPRVAGTIETYAAMSLLRTGEILRARAILERQLADARATKDGLREAALAMNLGTLERRAGELPRALEHFESADARAAEVRSAALSAQVRGAFAALLRDLGDLARAEEMALSAIALRQRLGDHAGVHVARGVLALTLAERGHVGRAATEADLAGQALASSGRLQDAALLETTADECRARMGGALSAEEHGEWQRAKEGDPRSLLCRARAHAHAGNLARGRELALRARTLADSLGLGLVRAQADDWLALVEAPRKAPRAPEPSDPPLARLDLELHALLAREPFQVEHAHRLATELERRGRDDRAARVWIALAARGSEIEARRRAAARAQEWISWCAVGAREGSEEALRSNLLALPDPWPEDHVLARVAERQEKDDEMDVLRLLEINHRLLEQQSLGSLLGEIVDCALSVSGAERGFLVLEKEGELEFDTALDSRRGDIPAPEVEVSRSILTEALASMRPLRVSNAAADPTLGSAASVIALELRSVLCAPFRIDKDLAGVIYVDHRLKTGAFTERAERMLGLLADQAALAIVQVRRMEEIRRLNRRLNQKVTETESELRTSQRALAAAGLPLASGGMVGSTGAIRNVHRLIELAANTRLSVLLQGPSGSGKELAARALHLQSSRAEDPFVTESCAALPPALIESELFGSRRGAFTGAERDRAGLFERADHGTLFLDEVGELPLEMQAKLLRVLETGEVRRLGGGDPLRVDFRLVTATNRDLAREVREGRFRADLFYRLDGIRIELPSLAERTEDIPALVDHFLRQMAEPGGEPRRVSKAVLARLCARPWPGNVRELRNEVARLCVLSPGDLDDPSLVSQPDVAFSAHAPDRLVTLADLERDAILRALRASGGDKNEAARMLGISRAKIYQRLKDWGVGAPPEGASSMDLNPSS